MRRSIFFSFCFVFIGLFQLSAQVKVEKEYRVKSSEVPDKAVRWLNDAYEGNRKVKWYYEEDEDSQSFEAKLTWKDHDHSIEFDTNGNIEDIEVLIEWQEIPQATRDGLETYFIQNYQKHSIIRIQKQWTGSSDNLEDAIDENEYDEITTRYEIEFHGKTESEDEILEGIFDMEGKLLSLRKIEISSTENLIY